MQTQTSNHSASNESPSKQLANALDDLTVYSPHKKQSSSRKKGPNMSEEMQDVFHQVTKARVYNPGKKVTQEVQLVILPAMLAEQARQYLRFPDPNVGKLQQRKVEAAALIAAIHGADAPGAVPAADRNSKFDDPDEDQKLWIQQSLIELAWPELIADWEERERLRAEGKLKKGKKSPAKGKEKTRSKETERSTTTKKAPAAKKARETDSEDDLFASAYTRKPPVASTSHISAQPAPPRRPREKSSSESDSDLEILAGPAKGKGKAKEANGKVLKSPAKSPRRSETQTTARDAAAGDADVPLKVKERTSEAGRKPSKPAKKVPPPVLYKETTDSSDEDDRPAKPPILSFAKVKAQASSSGSAKAKENASAGSASMQPTLSASSRSSLGSTTVSDSATPSDGGQTVRLVQARAGRTKSAPRPPNLTQQVIDLCSSD